MPLLNIRLGWFYRLIPAIKGGLRAMLSWLGIVVGTLRSVLRIQRDLALENLVLRQHLSSTSIAIVGHD